MVKNLRFVLMSMLMLVCGSTFAEEVTIDFDADYATLFPTITGVSSSDSHDGDFTEATTSVAVNGVTVTVAPAEGAKTPSRIWGTSPRLRLYSGTFTINGTDITKIVFNTGSNFNVTAASGTLNGKIWTGDKTNEVVFQVSKNTQIKSIVVTLGESSDPVITEGQTPETAITVTRALELIAALDNGATTIESYYVKGEVVAVERVTTSNCTFTIGDDVTAEEVVKVYNAKGLENKDITDTKFINAGDAVVVFGQLQKYVKNDVVTPEVSYGYVYSVNGETKAEELVEPTIEGGTTPETAISVSAALTAIESMRDNQTTTNSYYVKGAVKEVTEINTANGNATFVIAEETGAQITVWRAKGLENKNITAEDYLKVDDQVIVYVKLQKYVKDNESKPELSNGYIYDLNGKTKEDVEPVVLEGDGTLEKPYTVADLKKMTEDTYPAEKAWVKGVIVGVASSATSLKEEIGETDKSNIAIAADATAAEFVPVQLPVGMFREALNLFDNPTLLGKDIKIFGQITKYFSTSGIKDIEGYEMDGVVTGIKSLNAAEKAQDGIIYNLKGQRVEKAVKGLYIQNGKKFVK